MCLPHTFLRIKSKIHVLTIHLEKLICTNWCRCRILLKFGLICKYIFCIDRKQSTNYVRLNLCLSFLRKQRGGHKEVSQASHDGGLDDASCLDIAKGCFWQDPSKNPEFTKVSFFHIYGNFCMMQDSRLEAVLISLGRC